MHGLQGDFATMPLKDLVVYLGNRLATGSLTLERDSTRKQVVLDAGMVVNASSNLPREYLGQFLINLGYITEEQFDRAYQTQKETKIFLGQILVMIGLVSEETVVAVLSVKFRETLLEAFEWTSGTFLFEPGEPAKQADGIEVRIPLLEVHKESDFRVQAWEQFRRAFPSGRCTLSLKVENLVEPPRPGSVDEKIISAIEVGETLDAIALSLHATDFFLYNRLYALYRLGAIEVVPPSSIDAELFEDVDLGLSDSPTAEQLLHNARAFFLQNNYRDAFSLARRSQLMAPTLDAQLMLKQIETAWQPQLHAELVGRPRVPVLVVGQNHLRDLSLAAPERYLLSRIDGKRDLESIVRVAPLKEFEALAFIDRFVVNGWITLS